MSILETVTFSGITVVAATRDRLLQYISAYACSNLRFSPLTISPITALDIFTCLLSKKKREFHRQVTLHFCASWYLAYIIRYVSRVETVLIQPSGLFFDILLIMHNNKMKCCCIGGTEKSHRNFSTCIDRTIPGNRITSFVKTAVADSRPADVLLLVKKSNPDLIFFDNELLLKKYYLDVLSAENRACCIGYFGKDEMAVFAQYGRKSVSRPRKPCIEPFLFAVLNPVYFFVSPLYFVFLILIVVLKKRHKILISKRSV